MAKKKDDMTFETIKPQLGQHKAALFFNNKAGTAIIKIDVQQNGDAKVLVDNKVIWSRNINEYII